MLGFPRHQAREVVNRPMMRHEKLRTDSTRRDCDAVCSAETRMELVGRLNVAVRLLRADLLVPYPNR